MKLQSIKDLSKLPSVIEIDKLNEYLIQLVNIIENDSSISKTRGAELINDLISYQSQNYIGIGTLASQTILNWTKKNYNSNSQEAIDWNSGNLANLNCSGVTEFINERIAISKSEPEKFELNDLLDEIEANKSLPRINEEKVQEITERVNQYFQDQLEEGKMEELFCGIKNSIAEHDLCFSISWCLNNEKHLSSSKKTLFVGGGRLLVSKISDEIEMTGSSPSVNWIEEFELKIQGLEGYWCLEIEYNKNQISTIKSLLNYSTPELLKKVNKDSKILVEGEDYELQELKEYLDNANVDSKLEYRGRKKITNTI